MEVLRSPSSSGSAPTNATVYAPEAYLAIIKLFGSSLESTHTKPSKFATATVKKPRAYAGPFHDSNFGARGAH
eukprot:5952586-Heterocapsa_arctica.AAC.1